jgi:glucokinase
MGRKDKNKLTVEQNQMVELDTSWSGQVLAIGAVVGALTGLGAAYLLIQRAKKRAEPPNLNAGEGVKLGILVLGLLRQVAMLGSGDDK